MILCEIRIKGHARSFGWWQFEVLPQEAEWVDLGPSDMPDAYLASAVIHIPVRREEVTEHRPPYVRIVLERPSGLSNT